MGHISDLLDEDVQVLSGVILVRETPKDCEIRNPVQGMPVERLATTAAYLPHQLGP